MPESTQHVDEAVVLSSLCGMTLVGLHAMHGKTSSGPIRHLILQAIELKEDEVKAAGLHVRKPKSKRAKQPG